jgi:hypothetical protein
VDLTVRLKNFASENGYDYAEVEEVAADVLEALSKRRV